MQKELSKHFRSETIEINRSQIIPAPYNPRIISAEGRASLKRGIKRFGVIGGFVWNRTTSHLVGGHQKLSILDEENKYTGTPETDYRLKVEAIQVDLKTEKELNILLNNPNAQGDWNYDTLRELLPDIDYKNAGLTEEDLNIIGVDFTLQTEAENQLADELENMMQPVQAIKEADREARKAHMKEVKEQVRNGAEDTARNIESYVTLSFDTYAAKSAFMLRFGLQPSEKFIKGEVFSDMVERVE